MMVWLCADRQCEICCFQPTAELFIICIPVTEATTFNRKD